jgi:hypothetical protein
MKDSFGCEVELGCSVFIATDTPGFHVGKVCEVREANPAIGLDVSRAKIDIGGKITWCESKDLLLTPDEFSIYLHKEAVRRMKIHSNRFFNSCAGMLGVTVIVAIVHYFAVSSGNLTVSEGWHNFLLQEILFGSASILSFFILWRMDICTKRAEADLKKLKKFDWGKMTIKRQ